MSMMFNSKSGEVEGDNWNLMDSNSRWRYGCRAQGSVCWIGAAVVCLGLLLLTMILVAHNTSAVNQWDAKYTNLINTITKGRDNLRDERDQLKTHFNNLTHEMKILQDKYNQSVASRDKLQEEVNTLRNRTGKPCLEGWIQFNFKCYYVSRNGITKTWESSRKDCQERGADLVIIDTKDEMDFVKRSYGITWIGLHRADNGLSWKWVDGTELVGDGFWQEDEPNNADGMEDCVEVSRSAAAWNDVPCSRKFSWVCEA